MEIILTEAQIREILAKYLSAEMNRKISAATIIIYQQHSVRYGYGPELKAKVEVK